MQIVTPAGLRRILDLDENGSDYSPPDHLAQTTSGMSAKTSRWRGPWRGGSLRRRHNAETDRSMQPLPAAKLIGIVGERCRRFA